MLIGGDNWQGFGRWYRAADIMARYPIVVYPRRGSNIDLTALPPSVRIAHTELLDISSTEVRQRVALGNPITGMVPRTIEPLVELLYY